MDIFKKLLGKLLISIKLQNRGVIVDSIVPFVNKENTLTDGYVKEQSWFTTSNNLIAEFTPDEDTSIDMYTTMRQIRGQWGEDEEIIADDIDILTGKYKYSGKPNLENSKTTEYGRVNKGRDGDV